MTVPIGEMARLHDISRQTLVFYDRIGLLPAARRDDNGYRYYDLEQMPYLREICFLKAIGVPLNQVHEHLQQRDPASFIQLLEDHEQRLLAERDQLDVRLEHLHRRLDALQHISARRRNVDRPYVEWVPERRVVYEPYPSDTMTPNDLHMTLVRAWHTVCERGGLPSRGFGSLLRRDSLATEHPLRGAGSIIDLGDAAALDDDECAVLPAGDHATMYKYGMPYDVSAAQRLLGWIEEQGYEPQGDVIDLCLLDRTFYDAEASSDFCRLQVRIA